MVNRRNWIIEMTEEEMWKEMRSGDGNGYYVRVWGFTGELMERGVRYKKQ